VFLDTKYLQDYKGIGFVNSGYIVSSLRQQMMAAGCLLQEKEETADYIVEGRIGALGTDRHDVVYGLPASNALSNVSTVVAGVPAIPPIPELSVARKAANLGATKLALFAYERESRQRVWQSGLSVARSTARDTWILGAGPFQAGTIYKDNVRFAGSRLALPFMKEKKEVKDGNLAAFQNGALYKDPREPEQPEAPQMIAADENARPVDVTEPAAPVQQAPVQQASGGKEAPAKEAAVQQTSGEKTDKPAEAPKPEAPAAATPPAS
jgi:hypothetical protein